MIRVLTIMCGLAVLASVAHAEIRAATIRVACGPLAEVRAANPGEKVVMRGPAGNDGRSVGELWVEPKTGSWTFVQVIDGTMACMLIGGYGGMVPVKPEIEGQEL